MQAEIILVLVLMNILRLVAAEKEKKGRPNPEFEVGIPTLTIVFLLL